MNKVRCAIYTRKSSEEGLDQAFNSLDAQREAGLDYVRSQKHEGWEAIDQVYDDGGFSGGTMKRPALERLLEDIDRGRIDVVVVYKVDRLSRSLGDFARMMQIFDEKKVSFVSVTQQFNTTISMGRLTLNMLLSFAQFEREVAGERIRDKIAATKKQGYWVCGQPPLGYRLQREDEERGLYIIPEEAETVRLIFERFVELKSPLAVACELGEQGFSTNRWVSSTDRIHGGKPLTQKYIHGVLTNPTYIGKVTHTRNGETTIYDGRHESIIYQDTWDRAQRLINTTDRNTLHRWSQLHLLKGKLRTGDGYAISPSSTHRPLTKRGATSKGRSPKRLFRYYVSQKAIKHGFKSCPIKSVNAEHLDDLVRGVVLGFLDCQPLNEQQTETRDHWIRNLIQHVVLTENRLSIEIDQDQLEAVRSHNFTPVAETSQQHPCCLHAPKCEVGDSTIRLTLDIQFKKIDGRRLLLSPDGDDLVLPSRPQPKQHIVEAIGLAYRWHDELTSSGEHIKPFTESRGIARTRIMKLLPLINLGPEILRHTLAGTLAPSVTLEDLLEAAKHLDWTHQARSLGLDRAVATY
ncbi:MAG: recombinase family protein [Phycisphaerales bacterium JB058]